GKITDVATFEFDVEDERGAPGEINGDLRQSFIHRDDGPAIAVDAALVADGLFDRLTQHDADIFDGVMRIDVKVPLGLDGEIDQAVARQQVEHVIEEADAGLWR